MEASLQKLEAQLKRWGLKIDALAAKTSVPGVPARYEAVIQVDELKALLAIANSTFDLFRIAGAAERSRLHTEMQKAWSDLSAAIAVPLAPARAVKHRA